MIRGFVEYALKNRFIIMMVTVLLLLWGAISFHNLPVEAYPDVANNYVQIITQWPGRAAEEVEQQVTIPIEIQMNGIPHLEHLAFGVAVRAFQRDADFRRRVEQRLEPAEGAGAALAVTLPAGITPQMGTDWSPVGQIFWYTLKSTNPKYDLMELKSLEDWTLEKQFKSVPNVVDVSSFGGTTREYQVRIDPNKLVAYGLSIGQVEQQLANNNVNAGGSFVEAGLQQINVRAVGLFNSVEDIEQTVIKTQNGTPLRVRDIATVAQGPKIRLGQIGKAIHRADGTVVDNDDVVEGIVLLRKGANSDETLAGDPRKGERAERPYSAAGREDRSVPGSQRPGSLHHAHGAAQSDRGHHSGFHHSVPVSRQRSRRAHRGADDSVFSAVRVHLPEPETRFRRTCCRWARWISAWWWMARW